MSVTAELIVSLAGTLRGPANVTGQAVQPFVVSDVAQFTPGSGNGQAVQSYTAERTISASGTDDLDLAGTLLNALGAVINFTAVRAIVVRANPGNTNNVVIGGAPANGFVGPFGAATHTVALRPGDEFVISNRNAGWPVTAATADILRIANSGAGTPVTYQIAIIGS